MSNPCTFCGNPEGHVTLAIVGRLDAGISTFVCKDCDAEIMGRWNGPWYERLGYRLRDLRGDVTHWVKFRWNSFRYRIPGSRAKTSVRDKPDQLRDSELLSRWVDGEIEKARAKAANLSEEEKEQRMAQMLLSISPIRGVIEGGKKS